MMTGEGPMSARRGVDGQDMGMICRHACSVAHFVRDEPCRDESSINMGGAVPEGRSESPLITRHLHCCDPTVLVCGSPPM